MRVRSRVRLKTRLLEKVRSGGKLHFTLVDPDKTSAREAREMGLTALQAGSDAILVGGSLGIVEPVLSETVRVLRETGLPVILFPSNINGLTPEADAVLFMYLLNTIDIYYLSGVQMQAAPIVAKMGLEPIPTAYIIVGDGGAAGYVGVARPIPYDRPEIVAAYALAGAMMGASIVYLEAGSGAKAPVPPKAVSLSKRAIRSAGLEAILTVGGGVRDPDTAREISRAGADALVTGTLVEEDPEALAEIVYAFKNPGASNPSGTPQA
jgi:phosphoglycerol geranylgeranyltransferase